MSLETINARFRHIEKEIPFRKLLACCLFLGMMSTGISYLINPNYLDYYDILEVKIWVTSMLVSAFMATYLILVGGLIASGILITWILIKVRDGYYRIDSTISGRALSSNHEFLHRLAYGLFTYLIWFIRGYNDPKFEEMETKYERVSNENMELKTKITEYESLILPHIARQNRSNFDFNYRLKKVEDKQNENIQTVGYKAQSNINTENSDLKKFKDLDE